MAGKTEELDDVLETGSEESGSDYLSMSDEDFLNAPEPTEVEDSGSDDTDTDADADTASEEEDTAAEDESEQETEDEAESDTEEEEEESKKDTPTPTDEADKEIKAKPEKSDIDYKAAYEQLTSTFKANGRDMQVNSVEEALTLMKMGANYNKKMVGLKPHLKVVKMLENEGLLENQETLSYLIDLHKKNPQAIQKFITESGVDPLTIDPEQKHEYTPSTYTVDDTELELDEVLSSIKDTPSYARTIHTVTNQMDAASKRLLLSQPRSIALINEHMENGIYDRIQSKIEHERTFGKLVGLSDIEAYKQVGDALYKAGAFNDVIKPTTQKDPVVVASTVPTSQPDNKLKDKKRAASPTKTTVTKQKPVDKDFNPLNLSDEEFEKFAATL